MKCCQHCSKIKNFIHDDNATIVRPYENSLCKHFDDSVSHHQYPLHCFRVDQRFPINRLMNRGIWIGPNHNITVMRLERTNQMITSLVVEVMIGLVEESHEIVVMRERSVAGTCFQLTTSKALTTFNTFD